MNAADIQQRLAASPFGSRLHLQVQKLDATTLILRMPMQGELQRSAQSKQFHGGAIATLIDLAAVYAVAAATGNIAPTVHLAVDYLAPGIGDWVEATAMVRRQGKRLVNVDVEILRADGVVVALGRTTFLNA